MTTGVWAGTPCELTNAVVKMGANSGAATAITHGIVTADFSQKPVRKTLLNAANMPYEKQTIEKRFASGKFAGQVDKTAVYPLVESDQFWLEITADGFYFGGMVRGTNLAIKGDAAPGKWIDYEIDVETVDGAFIFNHAST
jgi:hypothetical protein